MADIEFQSEAERAHHEAAIGRLCQQFPGRQNFIRSCYLEVLAPLISQASIRNYLSVLVSREIKQLLSIEKTPR